MVPSYSYILNLIRIEVKFIFKPINSTDELEMALELKIKLYISDAL